MNSLRDGRVRFLASVANVAEAKICVAGGADVIDCKDPARGALGALDAEIVRAIRAATPAHIPVSATIGDLPSDPELVARAVDGMAAAGADYVKIGMFPGDDLKAVIARAGSARLNGANPVGVLFADAGADFALLPAMKKAGFAGVLLDTANKSGPPLPRLFRLRAVARFIAEARRHGLFAGLAGSLRVADIPSLLELAPDILGFRGALCRDGARTAGVDANAVKSIAAVLAKTWDPREREGETLANSHGKERQSA